MSRPTRIAIVDDDDSVCKSLQRLLRSAGYEVETFSSSEQFLDSSPAENADCLVLDIFLPGKSGFELRDELAASQRMIPIVFVSGAGTDRVQTLFGEEAHDFLPKPIEGSTLLAAIEESLK